MHGRDEDEVIKYTCARCGVPVPGDLDAAIAAHRDRCFIVGDYVRWERVERGIERIGDFFIWLEGLLLEMSIDRGHCYIDIERTGGDWLYGAPEGRTRCDGPKYQAIDMRRIERPAKVDRAMSPCAGCSTPIHAPTAYHHGPTLRICETCYDNVGRGRSPAALCAPPAPTLYDGLTAHDCYVRWSDNRSIVEAGGRPCDMTPAQIAAGRAAYLEYDGIHRAAQLRAKQQEARERERTRVVVDWSDDE